MMVKNEVEDAAKRRGCFILVGLPTVFLHIALSFTEIILTDLIVYRTCLVSLKINSTDCLMLHADSGSPEAVDLEIKVEQHASMIVMTKSVFEAILQALASLFLGPWSDRGGRKPLLLGAFSGYILTFTILSFMSNWNVSPWYLLIALIPANIFGAAGIVKLASTCYISDTTAENERIVQLASLDMAVYVGYVLGSLVAPTIYENYGFLYMFGTAAVCCASALLYTYYSIPESVKDASKESMLGLFKIPFMKKSRSSSSTKRKTFHWSIIWLTVFAISLEAMNYEGVKTIQYLFTRGRLSWDARHYFHFDIANSVLCIVGLCGVLFRNHIPGVSDTFLATISLITGLGAALTKSLAWKDWHMYLAISVGIFSEMSILCMRSIVLKYAPAQDVGKIFSVTTFLDVLSKLSGASLYTLIYSNYLPPIYPSPVYLLSIGVYALVIFCVLSIGVLIRKISESATYIATAQEES